MPQAKNSVSLLLLAIYSILVACRVDFLEIEVPAGYVGWVDISYGGKCTASTQKVLQVDKYGKACRPDRTRADTAFIWYFYVNSDGERTVELKRTGWGESGQIWANGGSLEGDWGYFFVGSEEELKKSWDLKPKRSQ